MQGPLFEADWRQRLIEGSYSIKAAGIFQADPGYFANRDGPQQPHRQYVPRRHPDGRPIRHKRHVGVGVDRAAHDRHPVPVRLPALAIYRLVRPVPYRGRGRGRIAALSHGRRRAQLLRHPDHLLLRLLGTRQSKADSDHSPGSRLLQRVAAAGVRRRARLQVQSHEPHASGRGVQRHYPGCRRSEPMRIQQPSRPHPEQLPAAWHCGHLYARVRRRGLETHPVHEQWPGDHAVPAGARRRGLARGAECAGDVELHRHWANRARALHARPPASNIAIRSWTWSRGGRRRSSRSLSSFCGRTRPRSGSSPTRTPRTWCSAPPICSRSTSFPAGTASRAAAASMPGCSTPPR